jgi:hypothetical protein
MFIGVLLLPYILIVHAMVLLYLGTIPYRHNIKNNNIITYYVRDITKIDLAKAILPLNCGKAALDSAPTNFFCTCRKSAKLAFRREMFRQRIW